MHKDCKLSAPNAHGERSGAPDGAFILRDGQGRWIVAQRRADGSVERLDMRRMVAHYEHRSRAMRRQVLLGGVRAVATAMQRAAALLRAGLVAQLVTALRARRDA
jgi:hypothetical protein